VRFGAWLGRLFLKKYVYSVQVIGKDHLQKGPALIVMNHSNVFDPLFLAFHVDKPIHFLVTQPFMSERFIARVFAWLGQIPKRKLDFDTRSIRLMKEWCELGSLVAVFPEGGFGWDGYPVPFKPGLKQLINYLNVPVITVRLINGDRFWPPWAKHHRKTSLRIEIDAPKYFKPEEEIEAYIAEKLTVNPETCLRFPSKGTDLAVGLKQFLRFCPQCGMDDSLHECGDELLCRDSSCLHHWKINAENILHDKKHGTNLKITNVLQSVHKHLRQQWLKSQIYFRSIGSVDVLDCTRKEWCHLQSGFLELKDNQLIVNEWHLPINEITALTLDWGNLLLLRTRRERVAIRMPLDSRALWEFVIKEVITI